MKESLRQFKIVTESRRGGLVKFISLESKLQVPRSRVDFLGPPRLLLREENDLPIKFVNKAFRVDLPQQVSWFA